MKTYKHSAFTLVEVIVSILISALLLTLVLGSFWLLIKINQQNEIAGRLQKQTTFAMLRMSDKIKQYSIDYEAYTSAANGLCKNLSLDSGTQQKLCLGANHEFKKEGDTLLMDTHPLFSDEFIVDSVNFFVSPSADPFSDISEKSIQLQPKVTIALKVHSKKYENILLEVQSTISSRKYQE